MAQSVEHPTSAQVMISQFMSLSPASGSVLTAQSREPALEKKKSKFSQSAHSKCKYNYSTLPTCTIDHQWLSVAH